MPLSLNLSLFTFNLSRLQFSQSFIKLYLYLKVEKLKLSATNIFIINYYNTCLLNSIINKNYIQVIIVIKRFF